MVVLCGGGVAGFCGGACGDFSWWLVVVFGGCYVFCGFSSMSLLLMGFSNTYEGILHVLNCALTALNCRRETKCGY
jgi:hypothetical protein